MNHMAPVGTWNLDRLDDSERKERLLDPPGPTELLAAMIGEAILAAHKGRILLEWEPSYGPRWSDCRRIAAKIPVTHLLFDQLFNGRSGYRAQYYLSVEDGRRYNRAIVDGLVPAIQAAHRKLGRFDATWHLVEQSLCGRSSKIWDAQG